MGNTNDSTLCTVSCSYTRGVNSLGEMILERMSSVYSGQMDADGAGAWAGGAAALKFL